MSQSSTCSIKIPLIQAGQLLDIDDSCWRKGTVNNRVILDHIQSSMNEIPIPSEEYYQRTAQEFSAWMAKQFLL